MLRRHRLDTAIDTQIAIGAMEVRKAIINIIIERSNGHLSLRKNRKNRDSTPLACFTPIRL